MLDETLNKVNSSSVASQTLKSRVCYITQAVVFSVAVVTLVIWQAWLFLHLDVNKTNMNEKPGQGDCRYNDLFIGDGICDDIANVFECNFDDGDCCIGENPKCLGEY